MSDRAQGVESQIKELKVSGHTMALEPGLYCVYNAPGGPIASEAGLPGVRITAGPGASRGQITVTSFTADGWIGADSAALVRVSGAPAELLVTVYQAQNTKAEAPKLQVVLLSAAAPAPAAKAAAQPAKAEPAPEAAAGAVEVVGHVYGRGDLAGRFGEWMGEPGSQRWIEGFGVAAPEGVATGDVEYQAVLGRGWLSPWSQAGQFCGSRGMSLPILGMRVRLRGEAAKTHRVVLSASFVDGTRIGPIGDGEPCEAPSLAALEAFQLMLEPVAAQAAAQPAAKPSRAKPATAPEPAKPARTTKAKAVAPAPAIEAPKGRKAAAQPEAKPAAATAAKSPAQKPAQKPAALPAKPAAKAPAKPAGRTPKRTPPTTRRR